MPIQHFTSTYAVEDAAIQALTADPAGGAATYGPLIDVPGIKAVVLSGSVNRQELRGDNTALEVEVTLTGLSVKCDHARLSLDALAVMLGSTVADSGVTPNQVASMGLTSTQRFGYFQLKAKSVSASVTATGDEHLVFPKCKLSDFPELGFAEEGFKEYSFSASLTPRQSDKKWVDIILNETAKALAV